METEPRMPGEPQPSSFPSWAMPVMVGVIALLVASNGFTLWYMMQQAKTPAPVVQTLGTEKGVPPVVPVIEPEAIPEIPVVEKALTVDPAAGNLDVVWTQEDTVVTTFPEISAEDAGLFSVSTIHRVGTVQTGINAGKSVYLLYYIPSQDGAVEMGGPVSTFYRVIGTSPQLLLAGAADVPNELRDVVAAAPNLVFPDLTAPAVVLVPQSTASMKRVADAGNELGMFFTNNLASSYPDARIAFTTDDVPVWTTGTDSSECYFVKLHDGTVVWYTLYSELFPKSFDPTLRAPGVLQVTWNDGTKNTQEYAPFSMGGCGTSVCYDYVQTLSVVNLKKVGTLPSGDLIYELKEDVKRHASDTDGMLKSAYSMVYGEPKPTYDEFLKNHPMVFWKSPAGGYIKILNSKYMPAVECGKPVIYLYPTTPMHVDVKVAPTGGFSVTEPAYNDGWSVWADPSGKLVNDADQQTYPYLFWEGNGLSYSRPTQGFMVAKADVRSFLEKSLIAQGLLAKEYNEFIEFWLPKMQDKPYYFVTFVPQAQFNTLAPLNVTPKPDTIIRVFMDYQGLDQPISVQPQRLSAPAREGFTVIEWGGALHK